MNKEMISRRKWWSRVVRNLGRLGSIVAAACGYQKDAPPASPTLPFVPPGNPRQRELFIVDAMSGFPIAGAQVQIASGATLVTGDKGNVLATVNDDMPIQVTKAGYLVRKTAFRESFTTISLWQIQAQEDLCMNDVLYGGENLQCITGQVVGIVFDKSARDPEIVASYQQWCYRLEEIMDRKIQFQLGNTGAETVISVLVNPADETFQQNRWVAYTTVHTEGGRIWAATIVARNVDASVVTAGHELGHAVGLHHPSPALLAQVSGLVMNPDAYNLVSGYNPSERAMIQFGQIREPNHQPVDDDSARMIGALSSRQESKTFHC